MLELLKKNANRCIALVLVEILVISGFHMWEEAHFAASEIVALGVHLLLSLLGLCFYVIMRSKLRIGATSWYSWKRLLGEPVLYIVFDFLIIHVAIGLAMGNFELHIEELGIIILLVYIVNLYFDTSKHHCCHDHCN